MSTLETAPATDDAVAALPRVFNIDMETEKKNQKKKKKNPHQVETAPATDDAVAALPRVSMSPPSRGDAGGRKEAIGCTSDEASCDPLRNAAGRSADAAAAKYDDWCGRIEKSMQTVGAMIQDVIQDVKST